jgi:hypothetical protein
MPDDELFRLASQGTLRRPETLRAQVLRMLRDRKGRSLAENFARQRLELRKLGEFTPDPVLFPDFDEALKSAMLMGVKVERFGDSTGPLSGLAG